MRHLMENIKMRFFIEIFREILSKNLADVFMSELTHFAWCVNGAIMRAVHMLFKKMLISLILTYL